MPTKPAPEEPRLLPGERQRLIGQRVLARGALRVDELAQEFGVSEMTIRRDLAVLEDAGRLERTFGGAVANEQAAFETSYQERLRAHRAQKEAIALFAAELVKDGDTVTIDASTTGLALARRLAERAVTVVTNSLDVAQELRTGKARVILTGGWYRDRAGSLVGPLALQSLASLRVDHAFFSAKGVLVPDGFVDSDPDETEVKKAMLASAARVTALVTADKFEKRALVRFAPLDAAQLVVSDDGLCDRLREALTPYLAVQLVSVGANGVGRAGH